MANPAPPTLEEAVELLRGLPGCPCTRAGCHYRLAAELVDRYDATRASQVPAPGGAQGGWQGDP